MSDGSPANMKSIKINLCLIFIILFAGCAQNRNQTVKNIDVDVHKEEIDRILFGDDEPGEDKNRKDTVTLNNNQNQENVNLAQKTELVSHIQQSDKNLLRIAMADNPTLSEPVTGITLQELENIALSNHPEIQQSLAEVSSMKGQRFQVTRKPNPVVGYQAQEVGNEGRAGQQGAYVNQRFVTADKLELNGQIAGHLVDKKRWDWQVKELEIRNKVQKNFYEYQGALLKLNLAKKLLDISKESSKTVKLLIDAGESKKSQLLQAEIEVNRSTIVVNAQDQNVNASFRKLLASVGSPGLENESISGSLQQSFPAYDWDPLYQNMIMKHPSIQAANSQVQSAIWAIRRAEVQNIPDLQTQFGLLYDTATLDTVVGIQLGGALPVHDKNKGNVRSRYADYMKAVQEVERVKLELKSELAGAFQNYETSRIQSVKFQQNILPKEEESLKLISEGFQQGQDPYIQLLIVQKTYFESNQEFVNILINVNKGLADLRKLKSVE